MSETFGPGNEVRFNGRVLYLTLDQAALTGQLRGGTLAFEPALALIDNISTDEITPAWVCFHYDETLGDYALVGLREGSIGKGAVKATGAQVIVSGLSKGCGSSRETAPFAEKMAGIRAVFARTLEKIYRQNCHNIGLLTSTDFSLLAKIERGEGIPLSEFLKGLPPLTADIVRHGGLFEYNKVRLKGSANSPGGKSALAFSRPMTLVEKIIASHSGLSSVRPGDALFCGTDVRFSHEYVTPMAATLFRRGFGDSAMVKNPKSVFAFRDHLTFLGKVMPEQQKSEGLLDLANSLASVQKTFVQEQGIRLFGESEDGGSEAICHNAVLEELASPGQVVVGTDSHTCTAGALGCYAFGVGSTDIANAWYTEDVQVTVPATVRFELRGKPSASICAKDIMLFLMSSDYIRSGQAIGKVLEFTGESLAFLNIDERATLTNMAVDAGAATGIIAGDETTVRYLMQARGWSREQASQGFFSSDDNAEFDASFVFDLSTLEPMVATPGDPRNGLALSTLVREKGPIRIDIAYGGSCTGGKMTDMDMYSEVLAAGLNRGLKVKPGIELYIQFGSKRIKRYAAEKGYLRIFEEAGARLLEPSCGACINAGPGVSRRKDQVSVSAINRNYPGRSGPGLVYLASPRVVAASALAGELASPETLFGPTPASLAPLE